MFSEPQGDISVDLPLLNQPSLEPLIGSGRENEWKFPDSSLARLENHPSFRLLVTIAGTTLEPQGKNQFRMSRGSVLLSPNHKVTIHTDLGEINLAEGSVVSIDSSAVVLYVRDYSDRWNGHVVVKMGERKIGLSPGTELIVTSLTEEEAAWQQAVRHQIRRRDLVPLFSTAELVAFKGQFSIPDAMVKSSHFLSMKEMDNHDVQEVIDEVTKTAALLHLTDNGEPYEILF